MKFTNKHGLPEPFVRAVQKDTYDKGDADYSVSELLNPPRLSQLVKRHDAEITEDVSDRLWLIMGSLGHEILERAGREGEELTEKRLYAPVMGKKIGGKFDTLCLIRGRLSDYKMTSVWTYVYGNKPEWTEQLNSYAFLAEENHHIVNDLEIFAMFRDWSESKAQREDDYPKTNCVRIPIERWAHEDARRFLIDRVELHERAKFLSDEGLPLCTSEERWAKPTTHALMKPGGKRALVVGENQAAIRAQLATSAPGTHVVVRPGKSTRCESYCAAAPFCSQRKAELASQQKDVVA